MNGKQSTFLDWCRVFAAQIVLINHIISFQTDYRLMLGNLGVVIFFILSGFLICFSALNKRSKNPQYGFRLFFVDRFFRIFVPYIPCLILIVVLDYSLLALSKPNEYSDFFTLKHFLANLFMLQQHPVGLFADKALGMEYLKLSTFGSGRPLWTVAIEWWVYLLFGWLVLKATFFNKHPLKFVAVLLFVGSFPMFNMVAGTGEGMSLVWFAAAGFAYLYHKTNDPAEPKALLSKTLARGNWVFMATALMLSILLLRMAWVSFIQTGFKWNPYPFYDFNFAFILLAGFALIFIWLGSQQDGPRNSTARFFSDYSYSLYLIHYPVLNFLIAMGLSIKNGLANAFVYFFICNGIAIAFWFAFEKHYSTLKQLWLKRHP